MRCRRNTTALLVGLALVGALVRAAGAQETLPRPRNHVWDRANVLDAGTEQLQLTDGDLPAISDGYAYLVQGVNLICGPGALGQDSSGVERVNSDPGACP